MELKLRQIAELKLSEAEGLVTVAFAQLNAVDEDGDFTFEGAFGSGQKAALSAYQHASWPERGGLLPTGKGQIKEADGWAIFDGRFFMETDQGRNTFHTVKAMGEDQQWSYGYDVTDTAPVPNGVKAKRGLKALKVHEVSPVLLGAQPTTHTMQMKALKTAAGDVREATYAMGGLLRLIECEGRRGDTEGVATLRGISEQLGAYINDKIASVGSEEDLAELAAEAAAAQARYISEGTIAPELKAKPLAGETFDAMLARVLGDVGDFERRAQSLAELRLKEGRAISSARLEQFEAHAAALLSAHKTFMEIIQAAKPQPKPDSGSKIRAMRIAAAQGLAGVELAN